MSETEPLVEEIKTDIPLDTAESCQRKYNSLKANLKLHKLNNISYRIEILEKLLSLWDKYEKEVALSNYLDLGMCETNNMFNCYVQVRAEIVHALQNIKKWTAPRKMDSPLWYGLGESYVKPEPFGLVLIFSAWNCNFLTLIVPLVQAIAAGNLVIAKPASTSPNTCKVCLKILNELPHDVVLGCAGKPEVYTELLKHHYDLLVFTGSAAKGKIINQAVAPFLTPCILELGGQNPVIVEKTADLQNAAYNIIYGRHMFDGQACISPEYIMVDKTIKEKLVQQLLKTFEKFYTKEPEKSSYLGCIINQAHHERISKLVNNPGDGAKVLFGDVNKINKEKRIIPPFLFEFDNFEKMGKSELAKAEIFGPVLYLCPYDKIEEAVDYINDREKPLASYLFTTDNKIKEYIRENTSSGALDINDCLLHFASPYLPFGGVGNSGMGHYHGKWGFENMSHLKPVVDQSTMLIKMRYPPYSKETEKLLRKFMTKLPFGKHQTINFFLCLILFIVFIIVLIKKYL